MRGGRRRGDCHQQSKHDQCPDQSNASSGPRRLEMGFGGVIAVAEPDARQSLAILFRIDALAEFWGPGGESVLGSQTDHGVQKAPEGCLGDRGLDARHLGLGDHPRGPDVPVDADAPGGHHADRPILFSDAAVERGVNACQRFGDGPARVGIQRRVRTLGRLRGPEQVGIRGAVRIVLEQHQMEGHGCPEAAGRFPNVREPAVVRVARPAIHVARLEGWYLDRPN